jgi:hypothetical protein
MPRERSGLILIISGKAGLEPWVQEWAIVAYIRYIMRRARLCRKHVCMHSTLVFAISSVLRLYMHIFGMDAHKHNGMLEPESAAAGCLQRNSRGMWRRRPQQELHGPCSHVLGVTFLLRYGSSLIVHAVFSNIPEAISRKDETEW